MSDVADPVVWRPRARLHTKTTRPQDPTPQPPELAAENLGARKPVYLVTFSRPQRNETQDGIRLIAPVQQTASYF